MHNDVYEQFQQFETWVLTLGTRPTITIFMSVFIMLGLIAFFHKLPWPKSHTAWFFFCWTTVTAWWYLGWGSSIDSREWRVHVRFFVTIFGFITGAMLIFFMVRKYVFGAEDDYIEQYSIRLRCNAAKSGKSAVEDRTETGTQETTEN